MAGISRIQLLQELDGGGAVMKRRNVTAEAIRRSAMRSTRSSAALENRSVPVDSKRSDRVERFLVSREKRS
jgi:hypothetical protein